MAQPEIAGYIGISIRIRQGNPGFVMDLNKYLRELHEEKKRLDRVIASLEDVLERQKQGTAPAGRRGRKPGMSEEERLRISERMRTYWARKKGVSASGGGA
jgi:hypothetical protein